MDRVIRDDVSTADVLWYAAERIGKSSNGDEIQKICDYLVNKHWFQTAGDLRMAQLATEEWHSLQIPSRLKIAVQQVLDEVHYYQQQPPQGGSPYGYASYYTASAQGEEQQQAAWPIDQGYEGYYYSQEASVPTAEAKQYAQGEHYDMADEAVNGASHDYGYAELTTAEDTTDHVASEDYYNYHQQYHAQNAYADDDSSKVVEAHAVVVEEATTYEEILAPIPIQQWSCRQCTYLNPISESFCEMCHDHISASPSTAGVSFAGVPATAMTAPKQIAPYSASSERAGYGPPPPAYEYATVTPPPLPMSPLYSPSAPSYDEAIECGDGDENLPQAALLPPAPIITTRSQVSHDSASSIPSELAKQLAFQSARETNAASDCEIIHPTKVVVCQPPPPPPQPAENYFVLAFKGKAAGAAAGSSSRPGGTGAEAKSDHVRREEGTLTEYSF